MLQINYLQELLKPYSDLPLECDGFTRIIHYVLQKSFIPHKIYYGTVTWLNEDFYPHYWITVEKFIVDYALKLWFKNSPNGVFEINDNLKYEGEEIVLDCNETIFKILTTKF